MNAYLVGKMILHCTLECEMSIMGRCHIGGFLKVKVGWKLLNSVLNERSVPQWDDINPESLILYGSTAFTKVTAVLRTVTIAQVN